MSATREEVYNNLHPLFEKLVDAVCNKSENSDKEEVSPLSYNFPIQDGIEKSAFSVVRCENCKYSKMWNTRTGERECKHPKGERYEEILIVNADDFCSSGERDD